MKPIKIASALFSAIILLCTSTVCGSYTPTDKYSGEGDLVGMTKEMQQEPVPSSALSVRSQMDNVDFSDNAFESLKWNDVASGTYLFNEISLSDGNSKIVRDLSSGNILIDNEKNEIRLTSPGLFKFYGSLSNGRIISVADGNVRIILDNVFVSCESDIPVYLTGKGKKVITLAQNSVNSLINYSSYDLIENVAERNSIFSDGDITFDGDGLLEIQSIGSGIKCNGLLKINSGKIVVSAPGDALCAKNVTICGGDINLDSTAGNGIKVIKTSAEDEKSGFLVVTGGFTRITSAYDSVYASSLIKIDGTNTKLNVCSGNGSGSLWCDEIYSRKGFRCEGNISVTGGYLGADCLDNALDTDGELLIEGSASISLYSKKSAIKAELIEICGGRTEINKANEGIVATHLYISAGALRINSSGDGVRLSAEDRQLTDCECAFITTGGNVDIDSDGIGIDVSGKVVFSGGTVCCSGGCKQNSLPVKATEGLKINGGRIMLVAALGMIQTPVSQSQQNSLTISFKDGLSSGTFVAIKDGSVTLFSRVFTNDLGSILFSSPYFESGKSFDAEINGTGVKKLLISEKFSEIGIA